jgi:hypothetical protein
MEFSGLLDVDGLFKWNDIFTPAVQQPWQIRQVSNSSCAEMVSMGCSATMADQAGLKPVGADTPFEQGLSISKNCKIYQVFLFMRPARSFFDRALGSPQAYIPALTAVWIHYSKSASECEFGVLTSVLLCCSVGNEYQKRC